jgi:hypothetical protein
MYDLVRRHGRSGIGERRLDHGCEWKVGLPTFAAALRIAAYLEGAT